MSGEPEYLNIIGIQKATEGTTYADDNNKIMQAAVFFKKLIMQILKILIIM